MPISLFGYTQGGIFYRSTIYSYGELVQDLVPVLNSQGAPCLYDLVTKIPIYGSGPTLVEFESGPVVSPPFS